jgi:hypothetical protein
MAIARVETVATVIAAAVGEQAAATREITNSVHQVTAITTAASVALREVMAIAEKTDAISGNAVHSADEVGRTAIMVRTEVTDFLAAMSHGDEAERRLYERIPAAGFRAALRIVGEAAVDVAIGDISRGGMTLLHNAQLAPGTDVEAGLPGNFAIRGRVAHSSDGKIGIAFRQDANSLAEIESVLDVIRGCRISKAA